MGGDCDCSSSILTILATSSSALYYHNYISYFLRDPMASRKRAPGFLGEEFQTCCWRTLNTIVGPQSFSDDFHSQSRLIVFKSRPGRGCIFNLVVGVVNERVKYLSRWTRSGGREQRIGWCLLSWLPDTLARMTALTR